MDGNRGTSEPVVCNLTTHEPTAACHAWHCHSCGVDEPGQGYIVCMECGHLYRTARDLRRAYRRGEWGLLRSSRSQPPIPWVFSNEFYPSKLWVLWHMITVRAKNINFCQECSHDF